VIPNLNNPLTPELFKLENFIINHGCDVEQWFRSQWSHFEAPFMHPSILEILASSLPQWIPIFSQAGSITFAQPLFL